MTGRETDTQKRRWWPVAKRLVRRAVKFRVGEREPRIGLALGGGFARGLAHVGVLRVFERHHIPIHYIAGVSAGAIVAGAYASGATPDEIEAIGIHMKFSDVARWTISRMGFAGSERMARFLTHLLKTYTFEQMQIPLAVVATDLATGRAVVFRDHGDVLLPIRASCSYPGLFTPIQHSGKCLVDGAMGMEVPTRPLRDMGATRVIAVHLPAANECPLPSSMFAVVNRCFQIMSTRLEREWRRYSSIVITPEVRNVPWDGFASAMEMIRQGELAAEAAMPAIEKWLAQPEPRNRAEHLPVTA